MPKKVASFAETRDKISGANASKGSFANTVYKVKNGIDSYAQAQAQQPAKVMAGLNSKVTNADSAYNTAKNDLRQSWLDLLGNAAQQGYRAAVGLPAQQVTSAPQYDFAGKRQAAVDAYADLKQAKEDKAAADRYVQVMNAVQQNGGSLEKAVEDAKQKAQTARENASFGKAVAGGLLLTDPQYIGQRTTWGDWKNSKREADKAEQYYQMLQDELNRQDDSKHVEAWSKGHGGNAESYKQAQAEYDAADQELKQLEAQDKKLAGARHAGWTGLPDNELGNQITEALRKRDQAKAVLDYAAAHQYDELNKAEDFDLKADEGEQLFQQFKQQQRADAFDLSGTYVENMLKLEQLGKTNPYDTRINTEYREPDDRWTEEEKKNFYYLFATDRARANEYGISIDQKYNAGEAEERDLRTEEFATRNFGTGAAASVASVPANLVGGAIDYLNMAQENAYRGGVYESQYTGASRWGDTTRGAIAQKLNEDYGTIDSSVPVLGGKGLGDLYQLAMSMAESSVAVAAGGGAANAMFFGSAAASATRDALDRGLSGDRAVALGFANGAAEVLGETLSVEHLLKQGDVADFLRNGLLPEILKQGAVEGSEEVMTTILNTLADAVINGDDSEFQQNVYVNMQNGMSYDEAVRKARMDWLNDLGADALGGFLSGGLMSGGRMGVQSAAAAATTYQGDAKGTLDIARAAGEGTRSSKLADQYQRRFDRTGSLSNLQAARLQAQTQADINAADRPAILEAVKQRLNEKNGTQMLASDLNRAANAVVDSVLEGDGRKLSAIEREVSNELAAQLRGDTSSASWLPTQGLKTTEARTISENRLKTVEVKGNEGRAEVKAAKMVGGKLQLTVEQDGKEQTLPLDDLNLNTYQKQALSTLTRILGDDAASAFNGMTYQNLNGDTLDVMRYAAAFGTIRDEFGRNNAKEEAALASPLRKGLTDGQVLQALKLGQKLGHIADNTRTKSVRGTGKITLDGGTLDGRQLSGVKNQEKVKKSLRYKAIQEMAKSLGVDIVIYESQVIDDKGNLENAPHGAYKDGVIWLDWNAGAYKESDIKRETEYMIFLTMSHELTHFLEQNSEKEYNELREYVTQYLADSQDVDFNDLVARKLAEQRNINHDEAVREVIADACETMLSRSKYVEQLANEKPGLFQRIWNWIKSFFFKVAQNTPNTAEAKAVQDAADKISELRDNALRVAVESRVSSDTLQDTPTVAQQQAADIQSANELTDDLRKQILQDAKNPTAAAQRAKLDRLMQQTQTVNRETPVSRLALPAHQEQQASAPKQTAKEKAAIKRRFNKAVEELMDSYLFDGIDLPREDAERMVTEYAALYDGYFSMVDEAKQKGELKTQKQYADSVRAEMENGKVQFSMRQPVEQTDRLVAVHNKSVSGLRRMLQRGGVPFPSIAIKKAGSSHEGFGEVSIVFPRSTIDPAASRWNRLYSNDAWTPTEPLTEYEVSDKETAKIKKKIETLVGESVYSQLSGSSYLHFSQLEKDLRSSNGDIFEALKKRGVVKYAYLKSIGQDVALPVREKSLDGSHTFSNEQLIAVFDAIDVDRIRGGSWEDTELLQEIADVLNAQYEKQVLSKVKDGKEKILAVLRNRPLFNADNVNLNWIKDALRTYEADGKKLISEPDHYELDRILRNNTEVEKDPAYKAWIEDMFGGIIKDSGIPNGKDMYTASGNLRSFKATHVPATLDNIVQQMRKENERGNGVVGTVLRGAATKSYGSGEEMRADSGRLLGTHVTDKVFDSYMDAFNNKLHELASSATKYPGRMGSYDTARETLVETVRDAKTKAQMKNLLRKEEQWINYTENLVDDLWALRNDVLNMPAPYFEAKPRRVVSPDEALAYILPDSAPSDVKQMLESRGLNVLLYESGNEQDRLAKLNSVEGAQFSSRTGDKSDRELLLDASEAGMTDAEKRAAADYKAKVDVFRQRQQAATTALDALDKAVQAGNATEANKLRTKLTAAEKKMSEALSALTEAERGPELREILRREREIQRQRTTKRIRDSYNRRELRQRVDRLWKDLNKRITSPTEKKRIPVELMQQAIDVLQAINMDTTREGSQGGQKLRNKLLELRARYTELQNDPDFRRAAVYDAQVAQYLDNMIEVVGDTPINRMSTEQLAAVYNTLAALDHTARNAVKVKLRGQEIEAYEVSKYMTAETRSVGKKMTGAAQTWINAQLSPERMFNRLGGYTKNSYWSRVYDMLNDGQLKQTQLMMEGSLIFEDLLTGKDYEKFVDPKNTVDVGLKDENGNNIVITHGMMVALYMHLQNEQNRRHVAYGGLTIPALKDYYSGKKVKGSENAVRVGGVLQEMADLNDRIREEEDASVLADLEAQRDMLSVQAEDMIGNLQATIETKLTDYDRQWIAASRELFDGFSKRVLNQTTLEVYGIKRANVENYMPIWVDGDFLNSPFESVAKDMSLENAGFMKERVDSSKPIRLADISDVTASQIRKVSQYCGLMPAIRAFNKVWGKTQTGYRDSLQKAVHETFGQNGVKYIENLMADLNGARGTEDSALGEFLNRMRGHMAQASLTLSLRTALGQTASYPTAASVLGWDALHKAFWHGGRSNRMISRADQELIRKWSPLLYYRMKGYRDPELGNIAEMNSKWDRLWKKARWATGWIQAMDGATVGRLWYAAEYYVQDHNKNLVKGTDAYYEAVAKKFNEAVELTQPNYTTMQRPDILRNPNALVKQLTMFLTQRLQNFNIVYDAAATYTKYRSDFREKKNGVTAEDVRQAGVATRDAVLSQVAAAATITAFKFLADALLHAMNNYRDDDKELTKESISLELLDMFIDSLAGNVLGGGELYDVIESKAFGKTYYGIEVSGVSTVTDFVTTANTVFDHVAQGKASLKDLDLLAKRLGPVAGIPYANAKKIIDGARYWVEDAINGEMFSFEAGVDRTTAQQAHRLYRAYVAMDYGLVKKIQAEVPEDKQDDLNTAVRSYIKQQYKDGSITFYEALRQMQKYGAASSNAMATFIKEQYKDGKINKNEAINQLVKYAGKDKEAAEKTMREYSAEVETGTKFSDIQDQFLLGDLSASKAKQMLVKYGGLDADTAQMKLDFWNYQNKHAGTKLEFSSYKAYVNKYKPIGLTAEQYEEYSERLRDCKGVDANNDGKTDSGSKKKEVVALIASLSLTAAQKDQLYFANNYGASGLKDTPWHK